MAAGCFPSLSAIPAVGAELVFVDADGLDHVVQSVVAQCREVELLTDPVDHFLVLGAVRICIYIKIRIFVVSFHIKNDPSGDQVHVGGGTGEVQILTAVKQRRAGRADMHFLCAALI